MANPVTSGQAPAPAGPGPGTWEAKLLAALGAPATPSNAKALDAWAQSEGTTWANNPLAISTVYPGATRCIAQCGTGNPVMAYGSIDDGVNATASFLKSNGYGGVIKAFASDAGYQSIWQAINGSGWCRGCQSGRYPVALYNLMNGAPPGSVGDPGQGSAGNGGPATGVLASAQQDAGSGAEQCLITAPSQSFLFFNVGGGCLFGTAQARAVGGAALMVAGSLILSAGLLIVVANGLAGSGVASRAAELAPGPVGVVARTVGSVRAKRTRKAEDRSIAGAKEAEDSPEGRQFKADRAAVRRATRREPDEEPF